MKIEKQGDNDVFNKVSGTTGLTGSAGTTFVLEKETRASDTANSGGVLYAEKGKVVGYATELLSQMQEENTPPNVITKLLNEYRMCVLSEKNTRYNYKRTKAGRRIDEPKERRENPTPAPAFLETQGWLCSCL